MNKENIKAILFDLDGTLFQSELYHLAAWNEALKEYNISIGPELYPIYTGRSAEWIEKDIKERFNANFNEGELIKTKTRIFIDLFGEHELTSDGLMPSARKALNFFKEKEFLLAICTGGGREETVIKLKNCNIKEYFDIIITANDVDFSKPAPDVYLAAINYFNLQGSECLAIEDTESGLTAAKAANAFCFAIPTQYSKKQNFEKADKILTSLDDLISFFNQP